MARPADYLAQVKRRRDVAPSIEDLTEDLIAEMRAEGGSPSLIAHFEQRLSGLQKDRAFRRQQEGIRCGPSL